MPIDGADPGLENLTRNRDEGLAPQPRTTQFLTEESFSTLAGATLIVWIVGATYLYVLRPEPKEVPPFIPLLTAELIMLVGWWTLGKKRSAMTFLLAVLNGMLVFTSATGVNYMSNTIGDTKQAKAEARASFFPFDTGLWFPTTVQLEQEGRIEYLDEKNYNCAINIGEKEKEIEKVVKELPQPARMKIIQEDNDIRETIEKVEAIKQTAADLQMPLPPAFTTEKRRDRETARAKEIEAFNALIGNDVNAAIRAFQASEDAFNGWNNVYEIGRILRANRTKMNDKSERCRVFSQIVKDHSWMAPEAQLAGLRNRIRAECN